MCDSALAHARVELAHQIRIRRRLLFLLRDVWTHRYDPSRVEDLFEAESEAERLHERKGIADDYDRQV